MKVSQVAELVNNITNQVLGKSAELTAENLKDVVDIGTQLTDSKNIDNYVKSLADHIGKMIFVDRPYAGSARPSSMTTGITVPSLRRSAPISRPLLRMTAGSLPMVRPTARTHSISPLCPPNSSTKR